MISNLAFVQAIGVAVMVAIVTVLWIFVAIAVYVWVLKPFVDWATRPQGGFFKRLVFWPVRKSAEAVDHFVKEHLATLKRWAAANSTPLVILFLQLAEVFQRIGGTLGDMSEQTYIALRTLRHETVPKMIAAALVPIKNQLARHTGRLDDLEDLNRRVAVAVGDALRSLPWGVPGGYVTNFATFLDRFVQLWNHYYDVTRAQLNTLLTDTIPQLRQDVSDLSRRLDVQIDARFDALGNRIADLERWRESVVTPRLQALTDAIDLLNEQIFEPVGGGLTTLLERVGEIERQLREDVEARFTELERGLAQLRTDLEDGIRTGLGAFADRIDALELAVFTAIPQALQAMQLAIDTVAAEAFAEVGAGLSALTARIVAVEQDIQTRILPGFDAVLGRIQALELDIQDNVLPRLRAIEDLLAPAAFGAFVLAALRVSAPYLFCRNVVRAAEEACAAPADHIDDLLLAAFALVGGISIIELAREMQAITGFVAGAIDEWVIED